LRLKNGEGQTPHVRASPFTLSATLERSALIHKSKESIADIKTFNAFALAFAQTTTHLKSIHDLPNQPPLLALRANCHES
jgi:hypothetical protein